MENNITSNPYIARMSNQRLEMRSLSPSHSRQLSDYREGQDMIRSAESNIHSYQTNAKHQYAPTERPFEEPIAPHLNMSQYTYSSLPSKLTGRPQMNQFQNVIPSALHPVDRFNEQYNLLQQARMHQQIQTHNEAMAKQHQTFAMRQKLNPPLSRQPSLANINLSQMHIATQTTSSINCSPMVQQPPSIDNCNSVHHSPHHRMYTTKPNQLQLQHEQLIRTLQNNLRAQAQVQAHQRNVNMDRGDGAESPVHQVLDYKESSISSSSSSPTKLLKSPQTKRQPNSLVTFSGWLYKQGSDGLRTWRRRWFVLSDYCLFYYKGPEEEKLLGSILLPSYTLSECLPHETKPYRKYSFKLEHKNMRTYFLASENGDYMRKWMRVIRAATHAQTLADIPTRDQFEMHNTESNIMQNDQWIIAGQNYPLQMSQSANNPFLSYDEEGFERQPLYANAPPKPRRSNNDFEYPFPSDPLNPFSSELVSDSSSRNLQNRIFGEYEEIHNQEQFLTNNPSNPFYPSSTVSSRNKYDSSERIVETEPFSYHQPKVMPPRPRSADFLEYESKQQMKKMAKREQMNNRLTTRPKSSLDLNSTMDNYYYSEASYAAKMRQSAMYIQNRNYRPGKDELSRNTLRYEKERKRLTTEFQNYTAKNPLGTNTLPSKVSSVSIDDWKSSPLKRKGVYSAHERSMSFGNCNEITSANKYPYSDIQSSPSTPERQLRADKRHHPTKSSSKISLSNEDAVKSFDSIWRPDISAGALLSKTHEELILLLIQLRRQHHAREHAMEKGYREIQLIQQRLSTDNEPTTIRLELMSKLEVLREQINKIEKQYDKNRPLVNLVDNMVKLGALYRTESHQWHPNALASFENLERLHSNQTNQERQMIAEEQKQWNNMDPHQAELNNKVQQLYEMDQILQEESDNLQLLQQDKADIEGALAEIKRKFTTGRMQPDSFLATKKIQHSLESELSKVHHQLAINSRKLEDTVTGNSRLERELLVLRQKLQASRSDKLSTNRFGSTGEFVTDEFDHELRKVQDLVGDMQRQRQELSEAVNQLTLSTNPFADAVSTSMYKSNSSTLNLPTYPNKRPQTNWTETDIDSMYSKNYGQMIDASGDVSDTSQNSLHESNEPSFDFFPYQDRPEIKTVRIVKRESERRQRDKDKVGMPMESSFFDHMDEFKSDYLSAYRSDAQPFSENESLTSDDQLFQPSISNKTKNAFSTLPKTSARVESALKNISSDLNPDESNSNEHFRSQTARQILNEITVNINNEEQSTTANNLRLANEFKRHLPRKKKRHNTAPNSVLNDTYNDYLAIRNSTKSKNFRARDDLDMEVALRTTQPTSNVSGPPDIVRSALGQNDDYIWPN